MATRTRKSAVSKAAEDTTTAFGEVREELTEPAKTPKAPKQKAGTWLKLTYDGSAKHHEVTPEVLKIGEDGKPIKRHIIKPATYTAVPIETYVLWGLRFPTDETMEFSASDSVFGRDRPSMEDLAVKARNLGCFKVECDEVVFETVARRAREKRQLRRN